MECSICTRDLTPKLPFNCPSCARTTLYDLRLSHAQTLLSRQTLSTRIAAVVSPPHGGDTKPNVSNSRLVETAESAKKFAFEQAGVGKGLAEERIQGIAEQATKLKGEMEQYRREIEARKKALARRRGDAAEAMRLIGERREAALDAALAGLKRVGERQERVWEGSVRQRVWLCQEAAGLMGLRVRRRRTREGRVRDVYMVAGCPIVDLREMNAAKPELISASLNSLARLVLLCSNYVQVKLPAEIVLPHNDYPLPTIFHPSSSYLGREIPFPGSSSNPSSNNSPSASKHLEQRPLPRPRTLFVEKLLPVLAKEDPSAYSLFIEGVTLLAWDIAWLCRAEGMDTSLNTWEEVANLGKNLWTLFNQPPERRVDRTFQRNLRRETSNGSIRVSPSSTPPPRGHGLGELSHATSYHFLGAAEAGNHMRRWSFSSPKLVIDRVKAHLQAETANAEWEVLDEKEWDDQEAHEEPVLVGGKQREAATVGDGTRSVLSVTTATTAALDKAEERAGSGTEGRVRGTSGWTKLKSRAADT